MKTMFLAFATIILLAFAADVILDYVPLSTQDVTSGPSVRLD
jgi:hypothetical protein